jgi:excisionase family DNA binding protein
LEKKAKTQRHRLKTYTVQEAAGIMGINEKGVYVAIRTGQIPHIKIGRRIVIPRAAFDRWFETAGAGEAA